jgi:hypothetical protein
MIITFCNGVDMTLKNFETRVSLLEISKFNGFATEYVAQKIFNNFVIWFEKEAQNEQV